MRRSKHKRERFVLRLLFGGAAAIVLLVLGLVGTNKWYHAWQAKRFLSRAQTYLSWGDLKSATLTARQVLEFDSKNADAFRILADVTERQSLSAATELRKKIADDHPDSIPDAVALAKTALRFGEIDVADAALRHVAGKAEGSAGYHEAVGQMAQIRKNYRDAEREFQQALNCDPKNSLLSLQLAAVQLRSAAAHETGQKVLDSLLSDKALRVRAAKTLLEHAVEHKDPEMIHYAELLSSYPETPFRDQLICLQLFSRLQLRQFASALTVLQERAPANPDDLTALISWMSTNNMSFLALDWIKRLPQEVLMQRPVFVAVADCYAATKDCAGLQQWCKKGNWPTLEHLRHAYLALAFRDCDDDINSELEWSRAVKEASTPDDVQNLQRGAAKWGWKKESIDLLWSLANRSDRQKEALGTLYQYYGDEGDTGNMLRVTTRLARMAPEDLDIQNNFAQLSLLLNVDVDRARVLARQLYEAHPTNANCASTYAYALYSQRHFDEAAKVMNGLKDDDLKRPEIAAYYGAVLASAGAQQKAERFLEIGRTAHLLPEEKKMVEDAVARR